jgi:hypothetical protein
MAVIVTPVDVRNQPAPAEFLQQAINYIHYVNNAGSVFIAVQASEDVNVTIAAGGGGGAVNRPAQKGFPAQTVGDIVVAVPANSFQLLGPFTKSYQNSSGQLYITMDAFDGVKIGALRVA